MSKTSLQITTAILGLIPIATGIIGLFGLSDPLYVSAGVPVVPVLDSNLRFFAGVWLGLGIALLWLVPRIESQTVLFRTIWGAIFLGGIGRLVSIPFVGLPPIPFVAFIALELVGAPIFVYWQHRVTRGRVTA